MDESGRMGSAYVCSEAGLTAKRPFRDLLTEEVRLLKIFLQVSCWPSAASLVFKCYLFVVPKTKAKYPAQSKLQSQWPSLSQFYCYIYLPLYLHWQQLWKKLWNGFHVCLHLVAAFLAGAIRPRGRQHFTVGGAIQTWSKETVSAPTVQPFQLRNCMAHSTNGSGRGTFLVKLFQFFFPVTLVFYMMIAILLFPLAQWDKCELTKLYRSQCSLNG